MLPSVESRTRGFALALGLCACAVAVCGWLAPALTLSPLLAFALAYGAVALEIVSLAACAPWLTWRWLAVGCGLSLGGLLALARAPASAPYAALLTIALGGGASLLGAAVGARIEKPGQLSAVALVSAIADLWSVFDSGAPSARLAEQVLAHPERLSLFALPFPLLGTSAVPALIGAGDVVFAALYVAAFRAHGLSVRRVLLALLAGFALGLTVLVVTLRPLPLLPLLGAFVLASEPATRSLSAREWRTVLVICAVMISAIALRLSS